MSPVFSELPQDSRFHNLLTLASKDVAVAPLVEEAGSNMSSNNAASKCDPKITPWSEYH